MEANLKNEPESLTVHPVLSKTKMFKCPFCHRRVRVGVKCCSASYRVVNLEAEPVADDNGRKIDFSKHKHGRPKLRPMKLR